MASYNRVVLLGNVTRDPELRYISNGTAVTDIGLAMNERRKTPSGEWVEETTFVDATAAPAARARGRWRCPAAGRCPPARRRQGWSGPRSWRKAGRRISVFRFCQ